MDLLMFPDRRKLPEHPGGIMLIANDEEAGKVPVRPCCRAAHRV